MTQRADLPGGTVTFVFTDIEGSTALVRDLGQEAFARLLAAHHAAIRAAVARHGGNEVSTEGDAFFLAFRSAAAAIAAAVDAQWAVAAEGVRIRIGLHTGEAARAGDNYVGLDVHRAARISGAAHGGQILASETSAALARAALPSDLQLRDLGEHRLKDLARPERLFQVVAPGLAADFPPLRSLDVARSKLPLQLTTFVGRERETSEAVALLRRTRLLTLLGPGGTGKTRFSLNLAATLADRFADGVFFVPLAPVTDPALVISTLAGVLGVEIGPTHEPIARVSEHLRERRVLLVLDNFEQVVTAAPQVAAILGAAAGVVAIVSSRVALRVDGEQEYPLAPLVSAEATRLFVDRARAVRPDFALTAENEEVVKEICARLDGLPLAIELAAARAKVLAPPALLARLSDRLTLLASTRQDLPPRQRTLRGAIDWSYDLLEPGLRSLFERLAVFAGGAVLEHIEEVSPGADIVDELMALVDRSLLRQVEVSGETRFLMLETIREYAAERLAASGGERAAVARHASVYVALAEAAAPHYTGPAQKEWLDRVERDHDNLRAAFDRAVVAGEAGVAGRVGAALWRFWQMRGHLREARMRLERVLALPALASDPDLHGRVLEAAGGVAYWQADTDATRLHYADALALARTRGDRRRVAEALYNLSFAYSSTASVRDLARTREILAEALAVFREIVDSSGVARTQWGVALAAMAQGEYDVVHQALAEAVPIFRALRRPFDLAWALYLTGQIATRERNLAAARSALGEALDVFAAARDLSGIALLLHDVAEVAKVEGRRDSELRLRGAVITWSRESGSNLALRSAETPPVLREDLAAEEQPAFDEGARLDLEEAIACAREVISPASGSS